MADTHRSKKETREFFDSPEVLAEKISRLVGWMRESKHMIAFTGAGVSTSAGIPDFRSGLDTVLKTGPGVWELKAHKTDRPAAAKTVSTLQAIPTPTHMALVGLERAGVLKHLISQNTDGLHRRSGFPPSSLSELHGNTNLETCEACKKEYLRDFRTRTAREVHNHITGRLCVCGKRLMDSIINFGENLPEATLERAMEEGRQADLCLAMGSSLTVTPAADIPAAIGRRRSSRLVIVNLQATPLNEIADLVIHATCDDVMRAVMAALAVDIPPFRLFRYINAGHTVTSRGVTLAVEGVDIDGTPFSLFNKVCCKVRSAGSTSQTELTKEPFVHKLPIAAASGAGIVRFHCTFMGHYGEPSLELTHTVSAGGSVIPSTTVLHKCAYDPALRTWTVTAAAGVEAPETEAASSLEAAVGALKVSDSV